MLSLLARLTLAASLVGLALSVWILASAVLPGWADLEDVKLWLITLFFVVGFPAIFIINRSLQEYPQKMSAKLMYAGCPVWMRRLVYGLLAFGLVAFFSPMLFGLDAGGDGVLGVGNSLALGGFGIALFAAFFAQVYSAEHLESVAAIRRCPAGHPVSLAARFCEECGRAILEDVMGDG